MEQQGPRVLAAHPVPVPTRVRRVVVLRLRRRATPLGCVLRPGLRSEAEPWCPSVPPGPRGVKGGRTGYLPWARVPGARGPAPRGCCPSPASGPGPGLLACVRRSGPDGDL